MTFELSLARALAHSAVYFSRSEQWPFHGPEPRNDGKDTASTTEEETNQQVGADATNGTVIAGGAGSVGTGSSGVNARGNIATVSGRGNTAITTIETSDPEVTTAALATTANIADTSLESYDDLANHALASNEAVATMAINAGVATTAQNATFGEAALEAAANAEANVTTALEGISTESQQTASNALAASQNETLAGVTPAQEFQQVSPTTPDTLTSSSRLSSLATILAIIVAVISIIYFLRKGKPA